ncbi:MAG: hypothetical protein K0S63_173 [Gammaproteobacteria bacterium]|jgi:hypothetical protein|nr:hypothetical protein [Gammaproteobacteria bacterium]
MANRTFTQNELKMLFERNLEKASVIDVAKRLLFVCEAQNLESLSAVFRFYLVDYLSEKEEGPRAWHYPEIDLRYNSIDFNRYSFYYTKSVYALILTIHDYAHQNTHLFEKKFFSTSRQNTTVDLFPTILSLLIMLDNFIEINEIKLDTDIKKHDTYELQKEFRKTLISHIIENYKNYIPFFTLLGFYFGINISSLVVYNNPDGTINKIVSEPTKQKSYIPNPENLETLTKYSPVQLDNLVRKITATLEKFGSEVYNNYIIDQVQSIKRGGKVIPQENLEAFSQLPFIDSTDLNLILKDPGLDSFKIESIENYIYYTDRNGGSLSYLPRDLALAKLAIDSIPSAIKKVPTRSEPIEALLETAGEQHMMNLKLFRALYHANGSITRVARVLLNAIIRARQQKYSTIAMLLHSRGTSLSAQALETCNKTETNSPAANRGLRFLFRAWKSRIQATLDEKINMQYISPNERRILALLNNAQGAKLKDTNKTLRIIGDMSAPTPIPQLVHARNVVPTRGIRKPEEVPNYFDQLNQQPNHRYFIR